MTRFLETFSTVILLIFLMILVSHMINGTATTWLSSKFKVAGGEGDKIDHSTGAVSSIVEGAK